MAKMATAAAMYATWHKAGNFAAIWSVAARIVEEDCVATELPIRECLARAYVLWFASFPPCKEMALAVAYATYVQQNGATHEKIEATLLLACIALAEAKAQLPPSTDTCTLLRSMAHLNQLPLWPGKTGVSRSSFEKIQTQLERIKNR